MKKLSLIVALLLAGGMCIMATGTEEATSAAEMGPQETITFTHWIFYKDLAEATAFEEQFKRETGTTLVMVNIPKDGATDKIQAMMVSGTFSDVSLVDNNITPLVRQGFLEPLDEYVDAHPEFKKLKTTAPSAYAEGYYQNKLYAIANGTGSFMNYWVRQDWLDALGLDIPDNMEDLVDMLQAFKDSDLAAAGQNVIPLVLTNSIWNHDVFSSYFGVFNEVVMIDGEYRDDFLTPAFKEYLDFMRDLYARGLLDREMPTNGYGGSRTKMHVGAGGSIVMWDDIYDNIEKGLIKNGIDGEAVPVPPFAGPNGVFGLSYSPPGVDLAITKGAENPKFVFDTFFDWFYFKQGGIVATSRGVQDYSFTVENGVLTPTGKGGVGFKGQKFPPVMPGFEYPFKFDPISQSEYDFIVQVREWAEPFRDQVGKLYPPRDAGDYWAIEGDLYDKKGALTGKYIMGEIDYDELTGEYSKYIKEIGLEALMANF